MSTAPVSVSAASARVTYPAGTVIYVSSPVPNEGPFPFPEFACDPAAIDGRLRIFGIPSRKQQLLFNAHERCYNIFQGYAFSLGSPVLFSSKFSLRQGSSFCLSTAQFQLKHNFYFERGFYVE